MNKVFITGTSGFIGKKIVDLFPRNAKLICISRKKTSYNSSKKNIVQKNCDLRDKDKLKAIVYKTKPNIVIHLASNFKTNASKKDIFLDNVQATENLLSCFKNIKLKQFIFTSSCAVYNKIPLGKIANEKYNTTPRSYYGKTKLIGERLIQKYAKKYHFNYTIFRLHMVYGKGDRNIMLLISLMKRSKIIPLINNGNYFVQPIFVDNVAKVIIKSVNNEKTYNKSYNLAGSSPILFRDLLVLISKACNSKNTFINVPLVVALFAAFFLELLSKAINKRFMINRSVIKRLVLNSSYDISNIKKDLNIKPIPIIKGIKKIMN